MKLPFDPQSYLFPHDLTTIPHDLTTSEVVWQVLLVVFLGFVARMVDRYLLPKTAKKTEVSGFAYWRSSNRAPLILFLLLISTSGIGMLVGKDLDIIRITAVLVAFWVPVALVIAFSRDRFAVRLIVVTLYSILALQLFGWLEATVAFLGKLRLPIGNFNLTALGIVTGFFVLIVLLLLGQWSSRLIEARIENLQGVSASMKVLIGKITRVALVAIAFLIAIDSMGLDLSVLTVFGGGIGLGLGFGLQKVVSNFMSGFILLTDRSIKPGDVIQIDNTFGWINNLHARYASVITRDGTEHLIPNEDLITQKVINWSYTNDLVRIKAPIGVSYDSDLAAVHKIVIEAAQSMDRVLQDPPPQCHLVGFGDSSVDLELRFWIKDPSDGVTNVRSAVLLDIWKRFKEEKIEIPFPQRDIHIRSSETDE